MKALSAICSALLILCLAPAKAAAFGRQGHRMTADIAWHYLSTETRDNVQRALGFTTPQEAATWMDDVREVQFYDYMKNWHFINIEKGMPYKPGGRNIISELQRVYRELQQPEKLSKRQRTENLLVLFHLMGDLHQPLHVGYGSDRGGNQTNVRYRGLPTDLHHIWDTDIIEDQKITVDDCLHVSPITPSGVTQAKFTSSKFLDYMSESRAKLVPNVYAFTKGKIDQAYMMKNRPVVARQLHYAGVRLAIVLNQLFGNRPTDFVPVPSDQEDLPESDEPVTISAWEAARHDRETVRVCGKIHGADLITRSGVIRMWMGAPAPNNPLTIVIPREDVYKFPNHPETFYRNKKVCVTGEIRMRDVRPQININTRRQIRIEPTVWR